MSQTELKGLTPDDYTEISGSHPMWYRTFQMVPGSNEHFVRLIFGFDECDDEITFGPMDANQVDQLAGVICQTYVNYYKNQSGPLYESGMALGIGLGGDEDAQ